MVWIVFALKTRMGLSEAAGVSSTFRSPCAHACGQRPRVITPKSAIVRTLMSFFYLVPSERSVKCRQPCGDCSELSGSVLPGPAYGQGVRENGPDCSWR